MKRTLFFSTLVGIILCAAIAVADSPPATHNGVTVEQKVVKPTTTEQPQKKEGKVKKEAEITDPILSLNKITFATPELRKQHLDKLAKAVAAIEDRGGKPIDRKQCDERWKKRCDKFKTDADPRKSGKAYRYKLCLRKWKRCYKYDAWWVKRRYIVAEAALNAQEKVGVDATFLIAVGRMESDFRNLILINTACKYKLRNYNCYADCGMTQHHVRGSMKYVQSMCKKLARSPKLSFLKSAEELSRHIAFCTDSKRIKRNLPTRRCVLNRYNQGTFYRRSEQCSRCWISPKRFDGKEAYRLALLDCKKRRNSCRHKAAYWKKVTCFEYGARQNLRSKRSCRRCYSLTKIRTVFYAPPQTDTAFTSFLFGKPSRK